MGEGSAGVVCFQALHQYLHHNVPSLEKSPILARGDESGLGNDHGGRENVGRFCRIEHEKDFLSLVACNTLLFLLVMSLTTTVT